MALPLRLLRGAVAAGRTAPQAFTSAATGHWNEPATWGAADYPRLAGDTVTIGAHTVTIPSGTTSVCGAITLNASANLVMHGTFDMNGTMSIAGAATLSGTSGTWYLRGYTVASAANGVVYSFGGTSRAAMFYVYGAGGRFTHSGANTLTCNVSYCSFNGLLDSTLGRSQTSAIVHTFENNDWIDCSGLELDQTGTNVNAGFKFNGNNIRACRSTMAQFGIPKITHANQAVGTGAREIKNNTYDVGTLPSEPARLWLVNCKTAASGWCTGNVLGRVRMWHTGTSEGIVSAGNFWFNTSDTSTEGIFHGPNTNIKSSTDDYYYYSAGGHCFSGAINSGFAWAVTNAVFEQGLGVSGVGTNWFINPNDAGTISNCIGLGVGFGNLAVVTVAKTYTTGLTIRQNTFYADNQNAGTASDYFPVIFGLEQAAAAITGTVSVHSNLHFDIDGGTTTQDYIVSNSSGNAITLNRVSHNAAHASAPQIRATNLTITNAGSNLTVDPLFADNTRKLSTWDLSLGGPGTAANAIAELLKKNSATYNSAYNTADLRSHVFAGFQPTGAGLTALTGTGLSGGDIGAR